MSSILDKLRDLVSALEVEDDKEEPLPVQDEQILETQVDVPTISDPEPEEEEEELEEEDFVELPDYLECSDQENDRVLFLLSEEEETIKSLGQLQFQYEKAKNQMLRRLSENKRNLMESLNSFKIRYEIPDEGYSVMLPTSESKVAFKKDN